MSTLRDAHGEVWHRSAAYRWAWLVWPQALIALAVGLLFWIGGNGEWKSAPGSPARVAQLKALYEAAKTDKKALDELEELATQGEPYALRSTGMLYDPDLKIGKAAPADLQKTIAYYTKATANGDGVAAGNLAVFYMIDDYKLKDQTQGCRLLLQAGGANGDLSAWGQGQLGGCLSFGWGGTAIDEQRAAMLFKEAAAEGDAEAQLNLGYFIEHGKGGLKADLSAALPWYEKAAAQGQAIAMVNLAGMYARGRGVAIDEVKARQYFEQARLKGNAAAAASLGYFYEQGKGGARDPAMAFKLYKEAADKGDALGLQNLGSAYANGIGTPVNMVLAAQYTFRAVELNSNVADRLTQQPQSWDASFWRSFQTRLSERGLYSGAINGVPDPATLAAVRKLAGK